MACNKKGSVNKNMPSDFAISFSYAINEQQPNILDTYQGIIQKDLITDGTAATDFAVPEDDLKEIYSKIREYKINKITQNMTSVNLTTTDTCIGTSPCTKYNITFTIDGTEYHVTGDNTAKSYVENNKMANNLCKFITYMVDYTKSTEEYKSLPKANGGYD